MLNKPGNFNALSLREINMERREKVQNRNEFSASSRKPNEQANIRQKSLNFMNIRIVDLQIYVKRN